ncbi:SDR family NAD(P)-dependent oxidoreductase [Mycobacterium vicinigordonae]|uniref:SDR family NAD(P)-dependent oxidoreductase n=1 Tax=Mycobacterium vicinigordonae TaxID=1719132 RepID=A0A7D6IAJ2_9MYCO|nr:SDR family NAD(P)-dependent oxidoreductase [Mycobacterium vicinigordonae]QLL09816.1 SDR family NAD(P)-dependent oxidoreductase [Mycobacterium vicinigordonae]
MATRVAVVTGAASGMGRLAAERLTKAGWAVAAVDLPGPQLDSAAAETGAHAFRCDVRDDDQVAAAARGVVAAFGGIDRLVNAAGIAVAGHVEDLPQDAFERSISVNYLGTVRWVKAVLPAMRSRGAGELILFASLAGWMPTPAMGAYTATKFAVVGFAETLAMELDGSGIRVRCVCPGAVQTPMLDDIMSRGMPERLKRLSQVAAPGEIIDAIEVSLVRRNAGIYVFPGLPVKVLWRARRLSPQLLGRVIRRLSAVNSDG